MGMEIKFRFVIVIGLVLLSSSSCVDSHDSGKNQIDDELWPEIGSESSLPLDELMLVSASQILPSTHVQVHGWSVEVAAHDGKVVFVSCATKGATIPSGEIVGVTTFGDIEHAQPIIEESGFAFVMPRSNGWYLAWSKNPANQDPVEWAFTRDLSFLDADSNGIEWADFEHLD